MTTSNNPRIRYLWRQFAARQATRAELDELFDLLSSGEQDEESLQYLQQLLETTPPAVIDTERWKPLLQAILHPAAQQELSSVETPDRPSRVRRITRVVMAAAAILILFGIIQQVWKPKPADKPLAMAPVPEIRPGSNKALLTLAGGQQIVLDSIAAGTLAMQGNTQVRKLAGGGLLYETGNKAVTGPLYNTLTTPRGGQYQLTLPDGTKVWLNAASSIVYPTAFTGTERVVQMTGEAYFEVAHDQKKPFKVKAGGQVIEDIGTRFNVNIYTDEPLQVTTLLEGAVRMGNHLLKPGEKASVNAAGMVEVGKGDPEQSVAWKNGFFDFFDASLQTVMRQLARWYNVDIRYEGNIPERQFNGMIGRSLTLDQLLKGLTKERVHYRIESGNHLIITP